MNSDGVVEAASAGLGVLGHLGGLGDDGQVGGGDASQVVHVNLQKGMRLVLILVWKHALVLG